MIDPHVHCRDEEQCYKTTIAKTLYLARKQGIDIIFDMPNLTRPVINESRVRERLALVPKGEKRYYRLYVGITSNEDQIKEAVRCYNAIPEVIGLKLFAGTSVESLTVSHPEDQRFVYQELTKLAFDGVLAIHCEKDGLLSPELWDSSKPFTHTLARPKIAEIESVNDQIQIASETGFSGKLHVCHVSCPESVEIISKAKIAGLNVTCAITPHHLMLDENRMEENDGLHFKTNPPLRPRADVLKLQRYLRDGWIDWIESDHAPHSKDEKFGSPYLSGYPSLGLYREMTEIFLPSIGFSPIKIKQITRYNIENVFRNKLSQ